MESVYRLSKVTCCKCGIPFWLDSDFDDELKQRKTTFYCPKGHGQSYRGEPYNQTIERHEQTIKQLENGRDSLFNDVNRLEKSIIGYKGCIGKMKKRRGL